MHCKACIGHNLECSIDSPTLKATRFTKFCIMAMSRNPRFNHSHLRLMTKSWRSSTTGKTDLLREEAITSESSNGKQRSQYVCVHTHTRWYSGDSHCP